MAIEAEDRDLASLSREGNRGAYALLCRRYGRVIHGLALARFMSLEKAEQVCRALFDDAFANIHTLKRPENFKSWLLDRYDRICKGLDSGKSAKPARGESRSTDFLTEGMESESLAAETDLEHSLLADLRELSEDNRRVLVLHFAEGLDYESMADALDVPLSTIRSRMSRAKMELLRQSGNVVDS